MYEQCMNHPLLPTFYHFYLTPKTTILCGFLEFTCLSSFFDGNLKVQVYAVCLACLWQCYSNGLIPITFIFGFRVYFIIDDYSISS
nr:MAG TPA: hypothetical protein [Caudoviricetes sp.]